MDESAECPTAADNELQTPKPMPMMVVSSDADQSDVECKQHNQSGETENRFFSENSFSESVASLLIVHDEEEAKYMYAFLRSTN